MKKSKTTIDVGASDPNLKNSPFIEENDEESLAFIQTSEGKNVCYFNGITFEDGQYVCSGSSSLLQCKNGAWIQVGTCDPENQ